ncbi:peptide/nickel transport system permease protein [Friedmanniella luteola]|uniref:Peptide/nickel transport system permease protein n=1 Tax=Friedmanniella luteola TaxID=546871 RepID=A0A1H1SGF7_9ACTN|nr:ABC transporter permease [Friedmanniella luteola]SDS47085.1 peptide/nickel transport system permease protein [Friedmanniella luteola]
MSALTDAVTGTALVGGAGRRRRRPALVALTRGSGLAGAVLLGLVVAAGLLAPVLAPYAPEAQLAGANLLPPGAAHLLGTDEVNRDVLSRTLFGIRTDLVIVFVAVPLGALLGTAAALLGTLATPLDVGLQRLFDLLLAFPTLIFAIGLTAVAGPGTLTVITVIAAVETPVFARVLRSAVLRVQELPYVEAARTMGAGRWWLLRRHVLPNAAEPLGVQLALSLSLAVFVESAMSFLGIGVRPPAPSLGGLVSDGIGYAETNAAYVLGPLAVVVVLVLALQLLAQAVAGARRVGR